MTADLERVVGTAADMLAKVSPEQLDAATPCASWQVRDVINHVVNGSHLFAVIAETGEPPQEEGEDVASGDFTATYAAESKRMIAAFNADGAMDKMMNFGFAKMPGAAAVNIVMTDTFTHVWDLARAIGEPSDLDPELAAKLLDHAKGAIPDAFRGEDGKAAFGAIVDVPASAPAADQLAGFLGRQV